MTFIQWLLAHEAICAGLVIAVVDFVIELNPALQSNTLVSLVLSGLQKLLPQPPAPPAK